MLKEQNKFIHPFFGIGTVQSIENRTILGQDSRVAVCTFPKNGALELLINMDLEYHLMRPLIKEKEVPKVLKHLKKYEPQGKGGKWHLLKEAYSQKLKGGDIYGRCEVIKELHTTSARRPLSFWERTMLKNSKEVLVAELSYVSGEALSTLEEQVEQVVRYTN